MSKALKTTDVIVVGAGMAGLTAARELNKAGISTVILDKRRAPGGRMATRTIDGARFDHGAQHFSARSEQFTSRVDELRNAGVVSEWYRADSRTTPGRLRESRFVGSGGMRRIPEHLANDLDVQTSVTVDKLIRDAAGITAVTGDIALARGSAIVLTPPVPQLLNLLRASNLLPGSSILDPLESVPYNPSLAVMATLDAPSGLPDGHLAEPSADVAWIADNQHKGTSQLPALTIHSTADFASAHVGSDWSGWTKHLADQVAPMLDGRIVHTVGHRWMYAEPRTTFDSGAIVLESDKPIVLAGEVFAGAKVEGAFLSGLAAANAILERSKPPGT
ncbi:MAG: FAD-dependent oxidoreductase [Acidimicrobiia bacterium]|nr:FAD-dependent oxidoreductase [Acidimicrobiia bacterium]